LPAAVFGVFYLYSFLVLPAAFTFGSFFFAWRWTHSLFTVVVTAFLALAMTAAVVISVRDGMGLSDIGLSDDFVFASVLGPSVVCAVASAEKLGRMVGSRLAKPSAG
jgi:hypothetical protein